MSTNPFLCFLRNYTPMTTSLLKDEMSSLCERKKILVVDDMPENNNMIKAKLSLLPYDVVAASSAREALVLMEKEKPDAVLLDIMMPEMDGFELLTIIRHNPLTAELPVIMLTAYAESGQKDRTFAMGANGYMSKHLIMKELDSTLQELFEAC